MQKIIAVIFAVGVVAAVPPKERWSRETSEECRLAEERETCFDIFEDAIDAPPRSSLKEAFQHYCRKIPDFVPCLVENVADYELMSQCPKHEMFMSAIVSRFDHLMTWREMFNMTIDFLDTANDIVCTRTDEIVKLIECIKNDDKAFQPQLRTCGEEHIEELGEKLADNSEMVDATEICSSVFGFATCMKQGFISMCGTEFSDLLDTVYYDVIEGVIGDGFGCEESNPLLDFARSVRNLYKK